MASRRDTRSSTERMPMKKPALLTRIWHLAISEVFNAGPARKAKNRRLRARTEAYLRMVANNGNLIEFIVEEDVPMAFSRMIESSVDDTDALAPARAKQTNEEAVAIGGRAPHQSADLAGARASGTGDQLIHALGVCLAFEASLCLFDRIECSACCAKRISGLKIRDLCKVLPSLLSERIFSISGAQVDPSSIEILCEKISWHHKLMRGQHWPDRWKYLKPDGRSSQFVEIHKASIERAVDWDEWHRWITKSARLARTRFPAEASAV